MDKVEFQIHKNVSFGYISRSLTKSLFSIFSFNFPYFRVKEKTLQEIGQEDEGEKVHPKVQQRHCWCLEKR